jgi:site-specific DNA-cytosine methylase
MRFQYPLRYGSVCSGIEAASLAWRPLGFIPLWFSEVEAFPNAVSTLSRGNSYSEI